MELIFNFDLKNCIDNKAVKDSKTFKVKVHFKKSGDDIEILSVTRKNDSIKYWLDVYGYTDTLIGMIRERLENI